jgi:hypothetical protein
MLRESRLAHPDERRELLRRARPLGDQREHPQPRVVAERPQAFDQLTGGQLRCHLLPHAARRIDQRHRERRVAVDPQVRPDEVTRREDERVEGRELDLVLVRDRDPGRPPLGLYPELRPQVG